MRLNYHKDTDSLYVHLNERVGVEAIQVKNGIVVDIDENGIPVSIDVDNTSDYLDLSSSILIGLPVKNCNWYKSKLKINYNTLINSIPNIIL